MEIDIVHGPGNSAAKLNMTAGETCVAEAGAMIAMSGNISVTTSTHKKNSGSILKAMGRMLMGESFFLNHFTAGSGTGELFLSATLPGDMMQYDLNNETLIVQSGSFVACEESVEMNIGWQGFKSMFSGESLFWIQLSGTGKVVLNAFGNIYPIEVDGEYIVDTGNIVAFNEGLTFKLSKAGKSWLSSILGGEGVVCKFAGKGTVWCQSHNPTNFGKSLGPKLPRREH